MSHCTILECSPTLQARLLHGQDSLLAEITELKAEFDHTLLRLRHENAELEITILAADLKYGPDDCTDSDSDSVTDSPSPTDISLSLRSCSC